MPTQQRLSHFVDMVISGRYVEAIQEYYADTAEVRENQGEARIGRSRLVSHELGFLSSVKHMRTRAAHKVVLDGDFVAIHWEFEMTQLDGATRLLDEVALQCWDGAHIVHEQYFYDPGQLRR